MSSIYDELSLEPAAAALNPDPVMDGVARLLELAAQNADELLAEANAEAEQIRAGAQAEGDQLLARARVASEQTRAAALRGRSRSAMGPIVPRGTRPVTEASGQAAGSRQDCPGALSNRCGGDHRRARVLRSGSRRARDAGSPARGKT